MFTVMATRKYEQTRRAEAQAETRRRIVEAIVELHREVGPARTTISAIAERAGVERLTVYRHFASETEMFRACSAHFTAQVGAPDPADWTGVEKPAERLRAALLAFYGYYGRAEGMLVQVERDAPQLPALREVLAPWEAFVGDTRDGLVREWGTQGASRRRLTAVVDHALRFDTWRSLVRIGALGDGEAADLMIALARAAVAARPGRREARRGRAAPAR